MRAQLRAVHRGEDLDVGEWIQAEPVGDAFADQLHELGLDGLGFFGRDEVEVLQCLRASGRGEFARR